MLSRGLPWTLFYLVLGTVFGLILSRSGAADYDYIQGMFLFEKFQLYGIIGTAVVVVAPGLWLLKRYGRTADGKPLASNASRGTWQRRRRRPLRRWLVDYRHVSRARCS